MQHRTLEVSGAGPAGLRKHPKHEVVFPEHLGDEMMHTIVLCDLAEPTKQRRTESTQVFAVSHDDRHLGTPGCGDLDVVAGDAEQLAGSKCAKGVLGVRRFLSVIVPMSGGVRDGR